MRHLVIIITLLIVILPVSNSWAQKSKHFYYNYDSSKERYENFDSGYVDTFSVNKIKFRIREAIDTENSFVLEKYDTKWSLVDTFYARQYEYSLRDLNNDGYDDLYADYRWQQLIYLFSPNLKTFVQCGYFSTDDCDSLHPVSLKDSLFYDVFDNKWENWWSYLYTIKNNIRYNLAIVEYKFNIGIKSSLKNEFLSVRKIYNDTIEKELIRIKKINFQRFDIKAFWLKNRQKFYPNRDMKPNENFVMYEPNFD